MTIDFVMENEWDVKIQPSGRISINRWKSQTDLLSPRSYQDSTLHSNIENDINEFDEDDYLYMISHTDVSSPK